MRVQLRVLFFFFAFLSFAFAQKISSDQYQAFLKNLGFEDYSAQIAANRSAGTGVSALSESVLAYNEQRLQIVNVARDLAVKLVMALEENPNPATRARLIGFTARMLALQPLDPPEEFPQRVLNQPQSKVEEAKLAYLTEVTRAQMENQIAALTSEAAAILSTKTEIESIATSFERDGKIPANGRATIEKIKAAQKSFAEIVFFTYLDSELGQTRYLGRALAACLAKYASEREGSLILRELRAAVKKEGLDLDNFLGDTLAVPSRDGSVVSIKVQNGDIIMERSVEAHAGEVAWGARPALKNYWRAVQLRLLGHAWDRMLPQDEMKSNALNLKDWARLRLAESDFATNGISHLGIATVLEDTDTGIKMAWALDNYPNSGPGGIRLTGIFDQFAIPGPFMRFALARFDTDAFYDFSMKEVQKRGLPDELWQGEKIVLDDEGEVIKGGEAVVEPWKPKISPEQFAELHSIRDRKEWHARIMQAMTETIRTDYMTKDGIGFAYGFSNFMGQLYCSQTVLMAALQSTGIDLQGSPDNWDRWNTVVKVMGKFGSKSTEGLKLDARIVAPLGLIVQPYATDIHIVTYPPLDFHARMKTLTQPAYIPAEPEIMRTLVTFMPEVSNFPVDALEVDERILNAMLGEIRKDGKRASNTKRAGANRGIGYMRECSRLLSGSRHIK